MLKIIAGTTIGGIIAAATVLTGLSAFAIHGAAELHRNVELALNEATIDDLERYRTCLTNYYHDRQNPVESVTSCSFELSEWMDSPNFSAEWDMLIATDSEVKTIIELYHDWMNL